MKLAGALLLALLAAPGCGDAADPQRAAEARSTARWELASAYRAAHDARDIDAALRLVCLDGSDTTTRDWLAKSFRDDFEKEIVSVALVPLRGDEKLESVLAGVRVVPNLRVEKRLRVDFEARDESGRATRSFTEYFVGSRSGRAMIASTRNAR